MADFMLKTRNRLNKILADSTGQTLETIRERHRARQLYDRRRGQSPTAWSTASPPRAVGCAEHRRVEKEQIHANDRRDDEFEGRDADIALRLLRQAAASGGGHDIGAERHLDLRRVHPPVAPMP